MPAVSIIMLTCNKSRYTALALDGLFRTDPTPPGGLEIVLVDNGSTDDTPAVTDRFERRARDERGWAVRRIRFETNTGAIVGRNAALAAATGEYVVFLDNDVVVGTRSWLTRWRERFEREPDLGVVGAKLLFASPPHVIQCAGCDVCANGRVVFRGRGEPADTPEFNAPRDVPCLISAAWMMRKAASDAVGELDELFNPVQFEDIDYCYRLRAAGWRAAYDPGVVFYHFENVTTDGGQATANYLHLTVANGIKFKRKWADVIAREGGPDSRAFGWKDIPKVTWDAVGEMPLDD